MRESDNTSVLVKIPEQIVPIHLMQPAGESSSPLPNGDGAGDSHGSTTPVLARQDQWYSNEGSALSFFLLSSSFFLFPLCARRPG